MSNQIAQNTYLIGNARKFNERVFIFTAHLIANEFYHNIKVQTEIRLISCENNLARVKIDRKHRLETGATSTTINRATRQHAMH